MSSAIDSLHFDELLHATELMCSAGVDATGRTILGNPSIGVKLGYLLLRYAEMKQGIRRNDSTFESSADRFMSLHKAERNSVISHGALQSLMLKRMNNPKALPLMKDIKKLTRLLRG